ncbi:unnamed protein product [Notodromas monacha]|uniref:ENTH domain-containing protein n=1 Tax=Notodromas monacha TaxID=399045 RepID=A0A7R9BIX8_9CRUS|nr:unnamed protein product [Notodromas monacha]CAG0916388.1 unnamed protein product [Notodromas monacha]
MAVNVAGLKRNLKNIAHNYTDAQVKVREATSNDPWGPSSTLMSEIADMTHNIVAFSEIMQMIWKRLNDHGKNWRHVYKALVLLEYLIKTGSDKVVQQCKENIFAIQTLKDFQYFEECKDYGMSVREKSKSMFTLLNDEDKLKTERTKALKAKERFHQAMRSGSDSDGLREPVDLDPKPPGWGRPLSTDLESARPATIGEEELQLQLALAMSKEEADQEEARRKSDDLRLQWALSKSKDENGDAALTMEGNRSASLDDILDLKLDAPMPGGASGLRRSIGAMNDPWGAQNDSDPWGLPKSNAPNKNGIGALDLADPWAPSAGPSQTTDSNDPWGSPPTNSVEDSDPFNMFGVRNSLMSSNTSSYGQNNGDPLGSTSGDAGFKKKKPEDFLGENSALVNLDNLVSKPTPASTFTDSAMSNPFALTGFSSATPQPVHNPFQTASVPRPTLNEMRMNQAGADNAWGRVYPDLANPFGDVSLWIHSENGGGCAISVEPPKENLEEVFFFFVVVLVTESS